MISQSRLAFGRVPIAAFALTGVVLPDTVQAKESGSSTCPALNSTIDKMMKDR